MAKMTLKGSDQLALQLSKLESQSVAIAKKAVYRGAGMVADQIRRNIEALPEETPRFLKDGDQYDVVTKTQKKALLDNVGITPVDVDSDGNVNAKIGFDRYAFYTGHPTRLYPRGLPVNLLARAIESGSSVRKKRPFVRPVIPQLRQKVKEAMAKVVDEETEKIMK